MLCPMPHSGPQHDPRGRRLSPGTEVEVLTRYQPRWTSGFEVASVDDDRYRIRRHSDGSVLPAPFGPHEIRPRH